MTKYEKWYASITQNAKTRLLEGYTESHHVVPLSLGGADIADNLVSLTAREHFICHWLLTKIHTGLNKYKMINALRMMRAENPNQQRYKTKITARVYANLKEEYSQLQSKRMMGKNNPMYGKEVSNAVKQGRSERAKRDNPSKRPGVGEKISKAKLGKKRLPFSKEWKEKLRLANSGENNGMYGKKHSDETKAKQSAKAIGRKQSVETVQKKADAIRGSKREKKLCPHCAQMISVNTFPRWHGDNCKSR